MEVFLRFKGRLLAAEEAPLVIEGGRERDKVILMGFSDEASWRDWAFSPACQEISRDRLAGSDGVALLLKGFGAAPFGT